MQNAELFENERRRLVAQLVPAFSLRTTIQVLDATLFLFFKHASSFIHMNKQQLALGFVRKSTRPVRPCLGQMVTLCFPTTVQWKPAINLREVGDCLIASHLGIGCISFSHFQKPGKCTRLCKPRMGNCSLHAQPH